MFCLTICVITNIVWTLKSSIAVALKQSKPFSSLEEELVLGIQHTADLLVRRFEELLKEYGVSGTQFNVLRILRGAGEHGLRCGEIAERMVTRDPDITRLLDRLEKSGYIERERDLQDRRVVITKIKKPGLQLLAKLDGPVRKLNVEMLRGIGPETLQSLVDGLDEIRDALTE